MGNQTHTQVRLIASEESWIEGRAVEQLEITARLSGITHAVGLPDLHPGRGYPIGAAFFSNDRIYPALVGGDIGCGMRLIQTTLPLRKWNVQQAQRRLAAFEQPLSTQEQAQATDLLAQAGVSPSGHDGALGSIGGGNHFAEWQAIDEVVAADVLHEAGIDVRQVLLLVHSGSRGLGGAILRDHVDQHGHAGLMSESPQARAYLARHNAALSWARVNRTLIAQRMLNLLRTRGQCVLDIHHNLVCAKTVAGRTGWLHRKGATPADEGLVIIPGSRGDYSYLVRPLASEESLYSLAHGAGRKWQRGECRARLASRYSPDALLKTRLGSQVICHNKQLLYEEAPEAYKAVDQVVLDLQQAGLVQIIARLKPLLTFKTTGGQG